MGDAIEQALTAFRCRLLCRLIHQPALLRSFALLLQRRPGLARMMGVVANVDSVVAVFHRQWNFTTAQAPNMRTGEFVIGMEAGQTQRAEREFLQRVLPPPKDFAAAAAAESHSIVNRLEQLDPRAFDLIDDYMAPVAWAPLAMTLGAKAARAIVDEGGERKLYEELRAVGAQLIIGPVSNRKVRDHADRCAAALNRRVLAAAGKFDQRWSAPLRGGDDAMLRNAVGMMWVGHPATVQAGAQCMQELLARPDHLRNLAQQVRVHGDKAWASSEVRAELTKHVLELLRLRPPFPILTRDVPRDTWFAVDPGVPPGEARAGTGMKILVAGALASAAGTHARRYCPGQVDRNTYGTLMFGHGARACIATDHVVETLVSALVGLLRLTNLRWGSRVRRIRYDGPTIERMPLRFGN